ncbi:hypothetical protein KRX51_04125 [Corynebacterium sp. TAE3-ERU12]|uniref:hypothetical protein n=1 Tax=Corynebacterium sp. TAE3-ERU12 TaxID=2849491 RepID=UPI001C470C84|nr:hypothetical protein [Corynebacterium sp. TAE3-ERU12]
MTEPNSSATPEPAETLSKYDNSRRPLQSAAKYGALALAGAMLLSLLAWGGKEGMPGVWGVVLGTAIGGGFVLLTVLSVWFTAGTTPVVTGAVVMGSWLLKVVALILVLALINDMTFYDKNAFFVTVIVALIVTIGAEVWGMAQENLTYVGSK